MEPELPNSVPPPPILKEERTRPRPEPSWAVAKRKRSFCQYGQQAADLACCRPTFCSFNARGYCKYGTKCTFLHDNGNGQQHTKWCTKNPSTYDDNIAQEPCPLFQLDNCWFGSACSFAHVKMPQESGLKLKLCAQFFTQGKCSDVECQEPHNISELETPMIFKEMPGYKACLCTFYVVDGLECDSENCFDAHGLLELRRQSLSVPAALRDQTFIYSDSHVHLDQVLWSHKYGTYWFYKHQRCKRRGEACWFGKDCLWVHPDETPMDRSLSDDDLESMFKKLSNMAGTFGGCVHSACEVDSIDYAIEMVEWGRKFADARIYASFGIHPNNFEEFSPEVEKQVQAAFDRAGGFGVAVGECGLDYYRRKDVIDDPQSRKAMMDTFAKQARFAVARRLPLVVHTRDAEKDTMTVLREAVPPGHPVHLHSYMGSVDMMLEFLECWPNSCVGVTGAVSYDEGGGGQLTDIVSNLPLQRMLLETDGPYMAPVPYRGEESHPGHIPWVAEAIANIKEKTVADVLAVTHANFLRVYKLPIFERTHV